MIGSTNPRILADNIRDIEKQTGGLASRVAALEATAPKDYSTTETATGQKWIDGKDIYCKVFTGTTSSETGNETIGTIANANFVNASIMLQNTSGTWVIGTLTMLVSSSTGNIVISKGGTTSYLETPYIIYTYYTKNPETREDDTGERYDTTPPPTETGTGSIVGGTPEELKEIELEEKKNTKKKTK